MIFKIVVLAIIIYLPIFAQGYVCAVGGGSENYNSWSDAPYRWIVQKSDSGKIIILSYSNDNTSWLPNYFLSLGASQAYNKGITSKTAADLQSTYDELKTAKAIFLRGGDQLRYINYWKGTKTEQAINELYNEGRVIAGTSAGAMVLGQFDFSARYGSITSKAALANPLANSIDIESNFVNLIPNVLFDTHFIERGRFARTIAMLFKLKIQSSVNLIAIGIDDATALCIEPNGIATVMGSGAVCFFHADEFSSLGTFEFPTTYVIERLKCDQLNANWKYNIPNRSIEFIPPSALAFNHETSTTNVKAVSLVSSSKYLYGIIEGFYSISQQVNPQKIIVLTHQGYVPKLDSLTNYFNSIQKQYQIIPISQAIMNDPVVNQEIVNSNCFVIIGDSTSKLESLTDTTTLIGVSIKEKINSNIPSSFVFADQMAKFSGQFYTDNTDTDALASYRGKMTLKSGLSVVNDLHVQINPFDNDDLIENRVSALAWGMMRNRTQFGIYIDPNVEYLYDVFYNGIHFTQKSIIVIDASNTTHVDSSTFRAGSSVGPRQVVAMNNLRYNITNNPWLHYNFNIKGFGIPGSIDNEKSEVPSKLSIQNYPNPFNAATIIKYYIPDEGTVSISIHDILGKETKLITDDKRSAGVYEYELSFTKTENLSSGIYFVKIDFINSVNSQTITGLRKIVYLK
jgi:cyanophycinase